ncbi:MAG: septum formation inhibitor [Bacteroidales bacterium]
MWQRFLDSKILKIIKNKFLIVGVVFAVWITFFDGNSLIDWAKVILDINEQEEQKSYYKQEIETTEEKLLELGSNLDSLEKFAREQYFFQEEGEDIFIVQEKK